MKKFKTALLALIIAFSPMALTGCGDSSSSQYVELTTPAPTSSESSQPAEETSSQSAATEQAPTGQISTALNLEFVLDGSGSMAGDPMAQAKEAIRTCVNILPANADINLGLVVFDGGGIREAVELGSAQSRDRQAFLAQVDAIEAGGGTPLAEAMNVATEAIKKQYARQCYYGNFRQIIVTDGQPDFGQNLDSACSNAVANHASLYTIGFGIGDDHPLKQWARSYQTAGSAQELTAKLKDATAEPTLQDLAPTK